MTRLLALAAAFALTGCVAWNDQCQPLVDNPNERVAFIARGTEIWLDRPNARHTNNVLGQSAADAFVWVFKDSPAPVDFAVVNGGAIRAEGLCVTRNILREGALSNGVLHEILLFENLVNAVDLSEQEVLDMFEHSAERLFAAPTPIASPAGSFLQVSKEVQLSIDCSRAPLSRVTSLRIGGQTVQRPSRPLSQVKYRLALPAFLLGGGDAYTMLSAPGQDASRNPTQAQRFGGVDSNVTAGYLKESPFNQTVEAGIRVDAGRITFTGCTAPSRPSN